MNFDLNEVEEARAKEFLEVHPKFCKETDLSPGMYSIEYIFTPTGIGTCIDLHCLRCGQKVQITDYESW